MARCNDKDAYRCKECDDAWENYEEFGNYGTNEAYGFSNINDVEVGNCIQFRIDDERYWLKVEKVCDCYYLGKFYPRPGYGKNPFPKGQLIRIEIRQVFNVERTGHWCIDYS